MAVLTMEQPASAAGVSTPVMLALAPTGPVPGTPAHIAALAAPGSSYNLVVNLTLHNSDGTTTPVTINAAQALAAALESGAYSTWLSGPQATQVRIDVPVAGSLHVTMDITDYADGTTSTDVAFNNDIAMSATGGTAVYDATITQNGAVAFQQSAITQYQYTAWDQTFTSNGAPGVNVQHDIAALEKTGLIQNYDLTTGVATSQITGTETTQLESVGFDSVLGNTGIYKGMPDTGARWDIGTTTEGNALWLMTQNATAAEYALDQANAAGSVPWHMLDPTTGNYLTAAAYPTLWVDPRGGTSVGYRTTALTQPLPTAAQTGWSLDVAHQPDNDYVAYLMTGDRYYLDQLNAQASYDVLSMRPNTNA
ncbi:MAG: beta strand repeat-containing protein, partial [Acetobacteraceae bacterium]